MAKILILYGTTEGQTAKIANQIAEVAKAKGHIVETRLGKHLPSQFSWEDFDAVIIGASVHYTKHQRYIRDLVKGNLEILQRKPSAFFSVSGAASGPREQDRLAAEKTASQFLQETGWQPDKIGIFAGAIVYTQYGFFKRLLMKRIVKSGGGPTDTSRDYEFTDWKAVTQFAEDFLASLAGARSTDTIQT